MSSLSDQAKGQVGAAPKPATKYTRQTNQAYADALNYNDKADFEDSLRGKIELVEDLVVVSPQTGQIVWSMKQYAFERQAAQCPLTVNPSLWRQSQLNNVCGLFEVKPGFYQVRGYDLSNMSLVEGEAGIIVIDPLISAECAQAALALYRKHRGDRPVKAVIYTHSHVDHYGGVGGVVSQDDVATGRVTIVAPDGFMDSVASENVYAGTAMGRRAQYMYGVFLPKGPEGQIDAGLGKTHSTGTITLFPPTLTIKQRVERHRIAGVEIQFQLTPETEAPSEMNFHFPEHGVMCAAENATHNLHNVLTLRGAQVRNALAWSKYLDQMVALFFDDTQKNTDALFAQHHWPRWGHDNIVAYVNDQRDMYRYLHDQTLRLMNKGYTGDEIAEALRLPDALAQRWYCRSYYGTVSHNVKAIYQRYMGWFDAHPADLWALPPTKGAAKYVEIMGGPARVIEHAREQFERGEYRWVAEVLKHVVFADPKNQAAKDLQADALEQLGYSAEAASWRNFFLMGARELRGGVTPAAPTASLSMLRSLTNEQIFDALAVQIDGPRAAADGNAVFNWHFLDLAPPSSNVVVRLSNGALSHVEGATSGQADCSVTTRRPALDEIMAGELTPQQAVEERRIVLVGDATKFYQLFAARDPGDPSFPIVTPPAAPVDDA